MTSQSAISTKDLEGGNELSNVNDSNGASAPSGAFASEESFFSAIVAGEPKVEDLKSADLLKQWGTTTAFEVVVRSGLLGRVSVAALAEFKKYAPRPFESLMPVDGWKQLTFAQLKSSYFSMDPGLDHFEDLNPELGKWLRSYVISEGVRASTVTNPENGVPEIKFAFESGTNGSLTDAGQRAKDLLEKMSRASVAGLKAMDLNAPYKFRSATDTDTKALPTVSATLLDVLDQLLPTANRQFDTQEVAQPWLYPADYLPGITSGDSVVRPIPPVRRFWPAGAILEPQYTQYVAGKSGFEVVAPDGVPESVMKYVAAVIDEMIDALNPSIKAQLQSKHFKLALGPGDPSQTGVFMPSQYAIGETTSINVRLGSNVPPSTTTLVHEIGHAVALPIMDDAVGAPDGLEQEIRDMWNSSEWVRENGNAPGTPSSDRHYSSYIAVNSGEYFAVAFQIYCATETDQERIQKPGFVSPRSGTVSNSFDLFNRDSRIYDLIQSLFVRLPDFSGIPASVVVLASRQS